MDIVDEAKELIPWLDEDSLVTRMAKHIEYLRLQNERLQKALVEAVAYVPRADWHYMTKETLAAIAKATGGD